MQLTKKKVTLEEKRLEVIRSLKKLPVKYVTEYNNYEIYGILCDIESELKSFYNENTTKGFGLRLKNNIMLYIFKFNYLDYALTDLDGEIISSTRDNIMEERIALEELYNYCREEVHNHYNKTMEKFNEILESI